MKIKIAMLQLLPEGSLEQNLRKGLDACIEAKKLGADIALFPEMWSSGYKISLDQKELESQAITKDSDFILYFKKLSQELSLAPNACPMEINRLAALRTRAYENMLAVCTCNYPAGQPDCNGHSTLFDGVAWLHEEDGVRDMCLFEAPETEGVYLAEVDFDLLRNYREKEIMGWKYRKTKSYQILTEK